MKIICFGDSLTSCPVAGDRYSDILQDRFPQHQVVNKGVGGESFVEARERFVADVLDERPDIVLIELGANDWWRDERPNTAWAADLEEFIVRIQKTGARAAVLGVFGLYRNAVGELVPKVYGIDERAVNYQKMEVEIARRYGCPYVSNIQENIVGNRRCWADSNHPNEYGNRCVADILERILAEMTGSEALAIRKPNLETTRDFWDEAVLLAPEKLAVVDGNRRLSYLEAAEKVDALAAGLFRATGVSRPKVAVYLPNCLEYFLVYWAVQRLGGVIVPLNTWLKEESLAGVFRSVQPDALFLRGPQDQSVLSALAAAGGPISSHTRTVAVETAVEGMLRFDDLLVGAPLVGARPVDSHAWGPGPDDLSIIMHTSGTTSTPKGAMMRHSDLMFNVTATINAQGFHSGDVHLLVNPMFHCTALYSSLPAAAYHKTPVIITSTTAPDALMGLVQKERITTFLSVPSVFQKILTLQNLDSYDSSSLRVMAFAGSPMPVPVVHALRQKFPEVALHNFFGLTETISATHVLRNDDVEAHPDSIGRLLPFVEAMVVDENDCPASVGAVGELLFAREEVISGYYNQPGRLEEAISTINGRAWFRTGDLALVDEEGFFYIKGRKKDMIIVGGENVFAAEVEAILMAHPGVREAAVKGVPAAGVRAYLGELVKAYVVRSDTSITEADLRRHCYEKLPSFKVPTYLVFVDELPRNPAGKVVKDDLPG